MSTRQLKKAHFDDLANHYDEEMPKHIRKHLLKKKTDFMINELILSFATHKIKGLDIGCGTGWHLRQMVKSGFEMVGIDYSIEQVNIAKKNNNDIDCIIKKGSITNIPTPNNYFDFIYAINVFHHLPDRDSQNKAFSEIYSKLKKGGLFFLQEINTDFFVFKFYMKYVFPLTSKIDNDSDIHLWLSKKSFFNINNFKLLYIKQFTFFPNFTPLFLFNKIKKIESFLERLINYKFGAHYMSVYKK